jgi:hypothetical protein
VAALAAIAGIVVIVTVLWEGFETMILPRRVTRRSRFTSYFYWPLWRAWKAIGSALARRNLQDLWLSFFGPLSILLMLSVWAVGLIVGFGLLHWAVGSAVGRDGGGAGLYTDLYLSGNAFFTLGLGDVVPATHLGRFLTVLESGLGFGFLALLISYLPSLNQSFARREVSISLLDARAGSPPCASEMLRRHTHEEGRQALRELLQEWERWSAEILESHQSYPVLAYFRSQHDNQSWLGALTAILDTCALVSAGLPGPCRRQAELTFAIARHAVVDLCLVFRRRPIDGADRLPPASREELRAVLAAAGVKLEEGEEVDRALAEMRAMYEPYVKALAAHFRIDLPPWVITVRHPDNWQVTE